MDEHNKARERALDRIRLQADALILQCNELIRIGVAEMGPHEMSSVSDILREVEKQSAAV